MPIFLLTHEIIPIFSENLLTLSPDISAGPISKLTIFCKEKIQYQLIKLSLQIRRTDPTARKIMRFVVKDISPSLPILFSKSIFLYVAINYATKIRSDGFTVEYTE